jgi:hypothetical protein
MENLFLDSTENTPKINLDSSAHLLEFKGESRPEEVQNFYVPVLKWLNEYTDELKSTSDSIALECNFKFEYFNSSSAKYVMDIVKKMYFINNDCSHVTLSINWYYDEMDEDMLDTGKEFEDMLGIPFKFIPTEL